MAITTRLQPKYTFRILAIAIVSIGLGVWGVYDYAISIPGKERMFQRGELCHLVKETFEATTGNPATANEKLASTSARLAEEIAKAGGADAVNREQAELAIDEIRKRDPKSWGEALATMHHGIERIRTLPPGATPTDEVQGAVELGYQIAKRGVDLTAEVPPPAKYDRIVKGLLFVPCLPFGLYMFWPFFKARRKVYRLDDDGTLHAPGITWKREEIDDIDMSRWMRKSIAHVVHTNGTRVKLDDYIYKNTHLIVGALASARYPEEWDAEAKVVPAAKADEPADADNSGQDDEAMVAAGEGPES